MKRKSNCVANLAAGRTFGTFSNQSQIAVANGAWAVRVKRTADLIEYITYDRAMSLADDLDAEGWRECAAQIRKAAGGVKRLRSYVRP